MSTNTQHGNVFNNVFHETQDVNFIYGYEGNDTIYAIGSDIDWVDANGDGIVGFVPSSIDLFDGGEGTDTVSYELANGAVYVDLDAHVALRAMTDDAAAADVDFLSQDQLISIENIKASAFHDMLFGNDEKNVFHGMNGNDYIGVRGGHDVVHGGNGEDTVYGGEGNDSLHGDGDGDLINGDAGYDRIYGGSGKDSLYGGADQDTLRGGSDKDVLYGGDASDKLYGDGGNDFLVGGEGNDTGVGGAGNDTVSGQEGDDAFYGGSGNDLFFGGDGADTAVYAGDDDIDVDLTADVALLDGTLAGTIEVGAVEVDHVHSVENVTTGNGNDDILGDDGDNVFHTNGGSDWVYGEGGNDTIFLGSGGYDFAYGGDGDDSIYGEAGTDDIYGNDGEDGLFGGDARDFLGGGGGDDTLHGGEGDDWLRGGEGADTIVGGEGEDEIHYYADDDGTDLLLDFTAGEDWLVVHDGFFGIDITEEAGGPVGPVGPKFFAAGAPTLGNAILWADAADGWTAIAEFAGIGHLELQAMIDSNELFEKPVHLNPTLPPPSGDFAFELDDNLDGGMMLGDGKGALAGLEPAGDPVPARAFEISGSFAGYEGADGGSGPGLLAGWDAFHDGLF